MYEKRRTYLDRLICPKTMIPIIKRKLKVIPEIVFFISSTFKRLDVLL
jgi:hypothetical protein